MLTRDGDTEWTSDNDAVFQEEFGELIDGEDIGEVINYLEDEGYLPPGAPLDIEDETDSGDPDDDDDDDDDDEDDDDDDEEEDEE